jgi:hypothetical protein
VTQRSGGGATATLFLLAGVDRRLPSAGLLAWRSRNGLDLLLLGFLGFPIASLLALGHVDLSLRLDAVASIAIFHIDAGEIVRVFSPNSQLRLGAPPI